MGATTPMRIGASCAPATSAVANANPSAALGTIDAMFMACLLHSSRTEPDGGSVGRRAKSVNRIEPIEKISLPDSGAPRETRPEPAARARRAVGASQRERRGAPPGHEPARGERRAGPPAPEPG